jgi:uncharacterized protein YbjQ (UPF0145 family)
MTVLKRRRGMDMLVTTTFGFEGYRIREYRGIVRGIIVRAPTIAQGIMGGLKSVVGGNIGAYTTMCEQTRQQAFDLLLRHAAALGANAVVGVRYDASNVHMTATEVLCYGTAVVVERVA